MLSPANWIFAPSHVIKMTSSTTKKSRLANGYGLIPYETNVKIPDAATEVDITYMLKASPERKCCVMYLQLIHIVSGSNNGQNNTSTYQSYFNKNKNKKDMTGSQFYRLFLFRDLLSLDGKVVYMVEGKSMNDKLWTRYPLLRDNGVLTIGTYIAIINPHPINQWFCNEIPIVECRGGCYVMKAPGAMASVKIDMGVTLNTTRAFVLNNVDVELQSMDVNTTKCSGHFCDRQRAIEIGRNNRACGCYSMPDRQANLVLVHHVTLSKDSEVIVTMKDFSSLQFSKMYMKTPFSSTTRFNNLDFTPAYFSLQKAADDVVEYINDNGGFTVIGWYKRGEINDVSNEESQNDVESSDIGYHIVHMYLTNREVAKRTDLEAMKFDISGIVV